MMRGANLLLACVCAAAILAGLPEAAARASARLDDSGRAIVFTTITTLACIPMLVLWFHWTKRLLSWTRKSARA